VRHLLSSGPRVRILPGAPGQTFYQHLAGPSRRQRADAQLASQIQAVHLESKGRYGAPRVHAELARRCHRRKRTARLMRSAGIAGWAPKRWHKTTIPGGYHAAP